MKKVIAGFLGAFISISILTNVVLAQGLENPAKFPVVLNSDMTSFLTKILNIPSEWLTGNAILFNVFLPFLAIFMIVLGFMKTLRIFQTSGAIQWVLSFLIAFMTFPTSAFLYIVSFFLQLSGVVAVLGFVALFIGGVALTTGLGIRKRQWRYERAGHLKDVYKNTLLSSKREVDNMDKRIEQIEDRIEDIRTIRLPAAAGDANLVNSLNAEIKQLEDKKKEFAVRLKELIKQAQDIQRSKL